MKNNFLIIIIITILSSLSIELFAKSNSQLSQFYKEQIDSALQIETHTANNELAPILIQENNEMFLMNTFSLRLRAPVGIGLEDFAKFEVIPEIELVFQKPNPEGWVNYRPHHK